MFNRNVTPSVKMMYEAAPSEINSYLDHLLEYQRGVIESLALGGAKFISSNEFEIDDLDLIYDCVIDDLERDIPELKNYPAVPISLIEKYLNKRNMWPISAYLDMNE